MAMHRNMFSSFLRKRFAVPLIIVLTVAAFYGVTFINMGKWLSAPFIDNRKPAPSDADGGVSENSPKKRGPQHKEEPFNPVAMFEVMGGVFSVFLLANAGEYVIEKLNAKR